VAGIAAGRGTTFSGVAPGANLIAIQVFSQFTGANCGGGEDPCALSFTSDQIAGLDRVNTLDASIAGISSVNMSLGGAVNTSACDSDSRKASIDNLLSKGIATAIASGNNGSDAGVSVPACISTAVAVGSTTKTDDVSSFSNHHALVDIMAPGSSINSSVPGNGFAVFNGTSMATPHVAGAWAIMRQTKPTATVAEVLSQLQTTGKSVTRSGVTKKRIRILAASARMVGSGMRFQSSFSGPGLNLTSEGVGLSYAASRGGSGSPGTGAFSITGIPAGASITTGYLFWQTLGGADTTAVLNGTSRTGTLVGASGDPCFAFNETDGTRTYRATVPASALGNGNYTVTGIGNGTTVDPEGASLVIIYTTPGDPTTGRVALRYGSSSANEVAAHLPVSFTGLTVSSAVVGRPALHLGIGDGQPFPDGAVTMNGSLVVPANMFSGSDGRFWDDDRWPLSTSVLPVGTTSRSITSTVPSGGDCLTMAYAALQYRQ